VTLVSALALAQSVLAGEFMSGQSQTLSAHARGAHAHNAIAIAVGVGVLTSAAFVQWRSSRELVWPTVVCLLLDGAVATEMWLGSRGVIAVHVPLGVIIIVCVFLLLAWAWRPLPDATGRRA
jgi:hypothetical protein